MSRKADTIKKAIEANGYDVKAVWWEQPTGTEELMEGGWFVQLADEEFGTAIAYDLPMALHYLEVLYPLRVAV